MQVALKIQNEKALYVTGEESDQQIRMRADRLNLTNSSCQILTEVNIQNIFQQIQQIQPSLLVIDSVQTLQTNNIDSAPGTISQIKECTTELISYAKTTGTPVVIIGLLSKTVILLDQKFWNIWLMLFFNLKEKEIMFIVF